MARRPRRNDGQIVLNIDDIAFIIMATEDNLNYWKGVKTGFPLGECPESKPHIEILEKSIIDLRNLKARRDAGEDVETEKRALVKVNADATKALNILGPKALEDALVREGIIPDALRSIK